MELIPIGGLRLRRALFGILLSARRPLTIGEVVAELHSAGCTTRTGLAKPVNKVVGDMLAHQVRAGRVRRVGRGTYAMVPGAFSRATEWRCRHWRDGLDEERSWGQPPTSISPLSDFHEVAEQESERGEIE